MNDLLQMDVGDVLDFIDTYVEDYKRSNDSTNTHVRKATQADFDVF